MSSNSDDDFVYTNSASMLKALKNNISIEQESNASFDVSNLNKNADIMDLDKVDNDNPVIIVQPISDDTLHSNIKSDNNSSTIILSDDDLNISPTNVISTIDNILERGNRITRSNRGRGAKTNTRGRSRGRGKICSSARKTLENHNISNSTDCSIILSDEDSRNTSPNVISTINSILQSTKKTRGRGKGRRGSKTTRKSVQNAQLNSVLQSPTIQYNSDTIIIGDSDSQGINFLIDVKVWWMSQYLKKFSIRRFDKLHVIFTYFSEKENIPEDKLIFSIEKKNIFLSKNDTPDSLNINAATIIEGGLRTDKHETNITDTNKPDKDCIKFKVQFKDRKRPLTITIRRTDNLEVLMHKTAAELEVNVKKLKFYFDGDLIKPCDSLNTFQFEGGECIDCIKYD